MVKLHSVAPVNMAEDEVRIAKGYQRWFGQLLCLMPVVVAIFAEGKWVVASGFVVGLMFLHEATSRLYDLCIRLRRTNELLSKKISN